MQSRVHPLISEGVAPKGLARTHMLILTCMLSNISVHFTQRLKIEIEMRERERQRLRQKETYRDRATSPWKGRRTSVGKSLQWGQEDRMASLLSNSLTKHFTTVTRLTIIFTLPDYYLASPNLQPVYLLLLSALQAFLIPLAMAEQSSVLPSSSALPTTPWVHETQLKWARHPICL